MRARYSFVLLPVVFVGAAAWSAPAVAAPSRAEAKASPDTSSLELLETSEEFYGKLNYEDANKNAKAAIHGGGLTHEQLVRAYRVLAMTHAVLDHEGEATDAFVQLLGCDPSYTVDADLGPRISGPFGSARTFWRAQGYQPTMNVKVQTSKNRTGTMQVVVRLPSRVVKRVMVGQRWGGSGSFTTSQLTALESTFDILAAPAAGTRFDHYVQALDAYGNVVLEAGSPALPRTVLFEGDSSGGGKSIWSSPWLYVGGGLILGGAAAAYVLSRPQDPTKSSLSPSLTCGDGPCR